MSLTDISLPTIFDELSPCLSLKELSQIIRLSKNHRKHFKKIITEYCFKFRVIVYRESLYVFINNKPICHREAKYEDKLIKEFYNDISNFLLGHSSCLIPRNVKTLTMTIFDESVNFYNLKKLTSLSAWITSINQLEQIPKYITKLRLRISILEDVELDLRPFTSLKYIRIYSYEEYKRKIFLPSSLSVLSVLMKNVEIHGDLNLLKFNQKHAGRQNNIYHGSYYSKVVKYVYKNDLEINILNKDEDIIYKRKKLKNNNIIPLFTPTTMTKLTKLSLPTIFQEFSFCLPIKDLKKLIFLNKKYRRRYKLQIHEHYIENSVVYKYYGANWYAEHASILKTDISRVINPRNVKNMCIFIRYMYNPKFKEYIIPEYVRTLDIFACDQRKLALSNLKTLKYLINISTQIYTVNDLTCIPKTVEKMKLKILCDSNLDFTPFKELKMLFIISCSNFKMSLPETLSALFLDVEFKIHIIGKLNLVCFAYDSSSMWVDFNNKNEKKRFALKEHAQYYKFHDPVRCEFIGCSVRYFNKFKFRIEYFGFVKCRDYLQ